MYNNYYYSYEGLLLITLPLFILLKPLTIFESHLSSTSSFMPCKNSRSRVVLICLITTGLYSFVFFSKNLNLVFSSDFSTLRYSIEQGGGFYKSSIFSKVAVFGAYLSPICLLLFFHSLIVKSSKKILFLLFFSSLSFILYTLNVAGRDGIVIWIFTYIALFCLFYPLMSRKIKKIQIFIASILLILIIPTFIYISIQRFSVSGVIDFEVIYSFFDYLGQQLYELSSRLDRLKTSNYEGEPRNIIPLFYNLWDGFWGAGGAKGNRYELRIQSIEYGLDTYRFSYFIGSLVTELGIYGVMIYTLVSFWLFRINLKIVNNYISLPRLIICFSWYMVIIVGLFYFYYGQLIGNVFLIFPFLLFYIYVFDVKNDYSIIKTTKIKTTKILQ